MENTLNFLLFMFLATIVFGVAYAAWWTIRERAWGILWALMFVVLLILIVVVGETVDAERPTITIKKDDWTCTQAVKRSSTTYVQTGQVMNPITTTYDDCVQYTRIAK